MMHKWKLVPVVGLLLFLQIITPAMKAAPDADCCSIVLRALRESAGIKVGMKRRDVEKIFNVTGGMSFRNSTVYTYSRCEYIHLKVEFAVDESAVNQFSPNDTITSISPLYINYEARD